MLNKTFQALKNSGEIFVTRNSTIWGMFAPSGIVSVSGSYWENDSEWVESDQFKPCVGCAYQQEMVMIDKRRNDKKAAYSNDNWILTYAVRVSSPGLPQYCRKFEVASEGVGFAFLSQGIPTPHQELLRLVHTDILETDAFAGCTCHVVSDRSPDETWQYNKKSLSNTSLDDLLSASWLHSD